jgi:hypothetical protein
MREYMSGAFDGLNPFTSFEEMSKQQLAMFERAVKMFSPFYADDGAVEDKEKPPAAAAAAAPPPADKQIEELRSRLNEMQRQLDELVSRREEPTEQGSKPDRDAPAAETHPEHAVQQKTREAGQQAARRLRASGS